MSANKPLAALIFARSSALVDRLAEALRSLADPLSYTHVNTYDAFCAAKAGRRWDIALVEYAEADELNPAAVRKDGQLDIPLLVVCGNAHEDQAAERAAALGCDYLLWDSSARRVQFALRHNLMAFERRSRCEGLCQEAEAILIEKPRLDALERVAGGVAHDFNNVTTVISTMANFVRDELAPDDPRYADMTEVIKAGVRASTLSRQLMLFSRRANEVKCLIDPSAVIESCEGLLRRTLGEGIEWRAELDPEVWPVFIDPVQFEQLLFKLALNACELMPGGGSFAIATRNRGRDCDSGGVGRLRDCVEMRVECTGPAAEAFGNIDVPGPDRPCKRLTDAGLAPVRTIVEHARGDLTISKAAENRLSFQVLLPRGSSLV